MQLQLKIVRGTQYVNQLYGDNLQIIMQCLLFLQLYFLLCCTGRKLRHLSFANWQLCCCFSSQWHRTQNKWEIAELVRTLREHNSNETHNRNTQQRDEEEYEGTGRNHKAWLSLHKRHKCRAWRHYQAILKMYSNWSN